jgi:AcrR family transcriptional regulator
VDTRQKLIDAAVSVFSRDTVEGARIEDIIAKAGVSRGTFFHYFPRKEDVLLSIAANQFGGVRQAIEGHAQDPDAATKDILLSGYTAMADTNAPPHLYAAVLREVARDRRRFEAMLGEGTPTFLDMVAGVLARGQEKGEVRDDIPVMLLAMLINSMVISPMTVFPPGPDMPMRGMVDMIKVFLDVLWTGVEPRGKEGKGSGKPS